MSKSQNRKHGPREEPHLFLPLFDDLSKPLWEVGVAPHRCWEQENSLSRDVGTTACRGISSYLPVDRRADDVHLWQD